MKNANTAFDVARAYIANHIRIITLVLGSMLMTMWTMARFLSKPLNFDLVGQQVLTHQWLSGLHGGAQIGATNYLLKVLFMYMPIDLLGISPRLGLIASTVIINVITFVLIVLILEKLWLQFNAKIPKVFYIAMLWFASAAGAIFWIHFANSRNLEVAGGLFLAYVILVYEKKPSTKTLLLIATLSGVLFFADPLQIYMSALPAIVYVSLIVWRIKNKQWLYILAKLYGALVAGLIISKVLLQVSVSYLQLQILPSSNQQLVFTPHEFAQNVSSALMQAMRLFSGGYELGRFAQAVNIGLVAMTVVGVLYVLAKSKLSRKFALFLVSFFVIDFLIYVLSGQAVHDSTSRYLIMTAPIFVLLLTAVCNNLSWKQRSVLIYVLLAVCLVNIISLALFIKSDANWNFKQDNHAVSVIEFMKQHNYPYGYAGMYTALPAFFLSSGKSNILSLKCETGREVAPSYLFFDKTYYTHMQGSSGSEVPIILESSAVYFPKYCNKEAIRNQFGAWKRVEQTSDGSEALIYDANMIQNNFSY